MISISYNKDTPPLRINKNLLSVYKNECDTYLVDIRRELTRSLVDYQRFQELQNVNNGFYNIIHGLDEGEFINISQLNSVKHQLVLDLEAFLKNCKTSIDTDIYEPIQRSSRKLMLTVHKLIQILTTINEE